MKLTSDQRRFWGKVRIAGTDECWEWQAGRGSKGYGSFFFRGWCTVASRGAWTLTRGPIPKGLHVLHACDNPPCVNPRHLRLGTHQQNVDDKMRRGRLDDRKGEANGRAKLTDKIVRRIRADNSRTQQDWADELGVTQRAVSMVKRGHTWRHVK